MNPSLNATYWENPTRLVVKIELGCTGKFRFENATCADFSDVVFWLKKFCDKWDFDIFDAFHEKCADRMRFYTFKYGRFEKMPNEVVYSLIHA